MKYTELHPQFNGLKNYKQFLITPIEGERKPYYYSTNNNIRPVPRGGMYKKLMTYDRAIEALNTPEGAHFTLRFWIDQADPFYFVDIDNCLTDAGWNSVAEAWLIGLSGAAMSMSRSGKGVHVVGTKPPGLLDYCCNSRDLGVELYTYGHAITFNRTPDGFGYPALEQVNAGDCNTVSHGLQGLIDSDNLAAKIKDYGVDITDDSDWIDEPLEKLYNDWLTDDQILEKIRSSTTGNADLFKDLLDGDWSKHKEDQSSADYALLGAFGFWTGYNKVRMRRLFDMTPLADREKWQNGIYSARSINRICMDNVGLGKFYGANRVSDPITAFPDASPLSSSLADTNPADTHSSPADTHSSSVSTSPTLKAGDIAFEYNPLKCDTGMPVGDKVGYDEVLKHLVYVESDHSKFLLANGRVLKPSEIKDCLYYGSKTYYPIQGKSKSSSVRQGILENEFSPIRVVGGYEYDPDKPFGFVTESHGKTIVNMFVKPTFDEQPGDITPLKNMINTMVTDPTDNAILWNYLAAIVQYPFKKFRWMVGLIGAPGCGKSSIINLFDYMFNSTGDSDTFVAAVTGKRLFSKFNEVMSKKIVVGWEEMRLDSQERKASLDMLKDYITSEKIFIERKGVDRVPEKSFAKFIGTGNDKYGALPKDRDDRRFAIIYAAQQSKEDIKRDNSEGVCVAFHKWLKAGGYKHAHYYLKHEFILNPEFSPAHRETCPRTSSEEEVIANSQPICFGYIENIVDAAVPGTLGGWMCLASIRQWFQDNRMKPLSPRMLNQALKEAGYIPHPSLFAKKPLSSPIHTPEKYGLRGVINSGGRVALWVHKDSPEASIYNDKASDVTQRFLDAQLESAQSAFDNG